MTPAPIQESSTRFLRIALISNNPVMRIGLQMVLQDYPFVAEIDVIPLSATAVDIVVRRKPQVSIVDLELSDADPLRLIRELRSAAADSHILVLSRLSDEKLSREALASGAEGVVLNVQPPAVLFAAIESLCGFVPKPAVSMSEEPANGLLNSRSLGGGNDVSRKGFIESLTARECDIVHALAKGLKNKEIADKLCISETTVRHHFTQIFSKVNVTSRQQLLIMAHQRGMVELAASGQGQPASFQAHT
jgi:DNA-binding NarL/FixJ family response regulator